MRISVVGWYGMQNAGDDAFHVVLSEFFKNHEVEFVTPPRSCNNPDIVILGGGAVASPYYLKALPSGKPCHAIGIDLAYDSEAELLEAANFKSVFVRTKADLEIFKKRGTFSKQQPPCLVKSMPDLAFYMKPSQTDVLSKYKASPNKKTICVFATDYVNPALDPPIEKFAERSWNFKLGLAKELDEFAADGYEIILVPCSTGGYGDDRRINLDLAAFMKSKPVNILDRLGPQYLIDLISQVDATICMRFHSHIFSMIAGTPFVSIEFTRKVKTFLQENGLQHVTGATQENMVFDFSKLRSTFGLAEGSNRFFLSNKAATYREEVEAVKQQVTQYWLGESP